MNNIKDDLKEILTNIHTIAIVGASSDPQRDSFKVMKFLIDYGYKIYPVNPNETNILGSKCYSNLRAIEDKINMVDVFLSLIHI
mgnify:FL=1